VSYNNNFLYKRAVTAGRVCYGYYLYEEKFEDTKGVIRSRKSKKGKQYMLIL
jgi:hypothetical protein